MEPSSAPKKKRRRRKKKLTGWQKFRQQLDKKWVQFLISMGVLTVWLKVNANDFDKTEVRTLVGQSVSIIVMYVLSKHKDTEG